MKTTKVGSLFLIILTVFLTNCASNSNSKINGVNRKDLQWYNKQEWLGGLKLTPDKSVNKSEFIRQYRLNPTWWNEAFDFLKKHDLEQLEPGSYIIDSNNVFATVSELTPKGKDSTRWEAHRNFNDLQYIIKGKARMGISSITNPQKKVTIPYSSEDNENFVVEGGNYYDTKPGTFFIFSPQDIHRPAFKIDGYDSIKKIVIKVRVPKSK